MGAAGLRGSWPSPLPVMVSGGLTQETLPCILGTLGEGEGLRARKLPDRRPRAGHLAPFTAGSRVVGAAAAILEATWATAQGGWQRDLCDPRFP